MIAIGFVAAFLSALIVVRWLIGFVSRRGFGPFAWYRIAVGRGDGGLPAAALSPAPQGSASAAGRAR